MKFASRIVVGLGAAFSLVAVALAQESVPSNAEIRHVIARAGGADVNAATPIAEPVLYQYAGRYDSASGVAFVIVREDDFLTIELPESFGGIPVRLHAQDTRNSFTTERSVRVVFQSDEHGRVTGLLFYTPTSGEIAATKVPLPRGIVTIHDLSESTAEFKIAAWH